MDALSLPFVSESTAEAHNWRDPNEKWGARLPTECRHLLNRYSWGSHSMPFKDIDPKSHYKRLKRNFFFSKNKVGLCDVADVWRERGKNWNSYAEDFRNIRDGLLKY